MGMLTEAARGREEEEAEKMDAEGGGKDPKAWCTLSTETEYWDEARLKQELALEFEL